MACAPGKRLESEEAPCMKILVWFPRNGKNTVDNFIILVKFRNSTHGPLDVASINEYFSVSCLAAQPPCMVWKISFSLWHIYLFGHHFQGFPREFLWAELLLWFDRRRDEDGGKRSFERKKIWCVKIKEKVWMKCTNGYMLLKVSQNTPKSCDRGAHLPNWAP